jgi:hypothetical protein
MMTLRTIPHRFAGRTTLWFTPQTPHRANISAK